MEGREPTEAILSWRAVMVAVVVFVVATFGFRHVELVGGQGSDWPQSLFQAFLLFFPNPSSLPEHGEPIWFWSLWLCYFAAPIWTFRLLAKVGAQILALLKTDGVGSHVHDHIIIIGLGTHGRAILKSLRERPEYRSRTFVVVDREDSNLKIAADDWGDLCRNKPPRRRGWRKPEIVLKRGDLSEGGASRQVLRNLGVPRSGEIYVTTDSDIINLNTALAASELGAPRTPTALISDPEFSETLLNKGILDRRQARPVNLYDVGAQDLLNKGKGLTEASKVVLLGFGRFGSAVARALIKGANVRAIAVLDRDAEQKVEAFRRWPGVPPHVTVRAIRGEIRDRAKFEEAVQAVRESSSDSTPIHVVVCTDQDVANITMALHTKDLCKDGTVLVSLIVRLFRAPDHLKKTLTSTQSGEGIQLFEYPPPDLASALSENSVPVNEPHT